jgi:c-di-GMP-binding flagellar brake protein YcgR
MSRIDCSCRRTDAMDSLAFPQTDPQNRALRFWIGAPLQLLAADAGQRAALMTRLSAVEEGDSLSVSCAPDAATAAALRIGQSVIALLYTGTEIAQFRSTVEQVPVEPSGQFRIAFPTEMRFHRLRREHRIPACIPAVVAGLDGRDIDATLIDFSQAGCHLACADRVGEPGEKVQLRFAAPVDGGHEAQVAIAGEVRWINPLATGDLPHYTCGIRFVKPALDPVRLEHLVAGFRLAAGHAASTARP